MQKKAAVLDPSPISALFVKAKLCYCTRSFIRRITYFLYVLIRVFGVLQAFLWANETYFFCGCRNARFFSFAFLSLQGDIERCFRFEKIENRQTKKNMAPEVFRFGARMKKNSRQNRKKVARVLPKNGTAISAFSVRFL